MLNKLISILFLVAMAHAAQAQLRTEDSAINPEQQLNDDNTLSSDGVIDDLDGLTLDQEELTTNYFYPPPHPPGPGPGPGPHPHPPGPGPGPGPHPFPPGPGPGPGPHPFPPGPGPGPGPHPFPPGPGPGPGPHPFPPGPGPGPGPHPFPPGPGPGPHPMNNFVTCSSHNYTYNECYVGGSIYNAYVYNQISRSACSYGYSWGYSHDRIWVDHGCRATFAIDFRW